MKKLHRALGVAILMGTGMGALAGPGHDNSHSQASQPETPVNHAHGQGHEHMMETLAGKPGSEQQVDRVIRVVADDSMRYTHQPFNIKDGETIKFIVTNEGKLVHEFAIGTRDEHQEHSQMMMENPDMHHGPGGNAVTLEPGETAELIWTFENAWQIEIACNIPGHYQAGMVSPVKIH